MVERSKLLDSQDRPLTQSLFLEVGYDRDFALYTLKEVDHEFEGKVYPSIKRLYLEMEDPTEYEFANEYFLGWKHWMRICDNRILRTHILEWREELEIKLRSRAVKAMIKSADDGNYQASKWLVDRGWNTRGAGRPSKSELEAEKKIAATINSEYGADIIRLKGM